METRAKPEKSGNTSAARLMLKGCVGVLIGGGAMIGVLMLGGFRTPAPFIALLTIIALPLALLYLWVNRSSDNKSFTLK
jgi:predicted lipid-binding transport protein (Tim44 family)